jgi:PHD/YefM family antitoxin component YafN of YafNO toxin-antitoxin module
MPQRPRIRDFPEYKGLSEARRHLSDMVEQVQKGEAYVIKSPKGQALMVGLDAFRELQESYLELEGRLAAIRLLEDKEKREALAASFESEEAVLTVSQARERYPSEPAAAATLAEAERLAAALREVTDGIVRAAASAAGTAAAAKATSGNGNAAEREALREEAEEAAAGAAAAEVSDERLQEEAEKIALVK